MLNAEKYKKEILKVCGDGHTFAKTGDEITDCKSTPCKDCEFNVNEFGCFSRRMIWLYEEYKKPQLKVTELKTKFTLSICYSDRTIFTVKAIDINISRDGQTYIWCEGKTDNDNYFYTTWDYNFLNECYQKGELVLC